MRVIVTGSSLFILCLAGCAGQQPPQVQAAPQQVVQPQTPPAAAARQNTGRRYDPSRIRLDLPWPKLNQPMARIGGGERDAAVIVAIERYDNVPGIPGAKANAEGWYHYFIHTLGIPDVNVKLMPQTKATREGILSALEDTARLAGSGGRIWFVFIGHGAPTDGDGLLLGVDVRQTAESLEARGLKQSDVLNALNQSRALPVLILDACFSGRTGSGDSVINGLMPVRNAELPSPGKAIVMTAASSDQYAGPLPGKAVPAFSYLALGAMRGWGDSNKDGMVSANEVVTYARNAMGALLFGRKQTPEVTGDSAGIPLATAKENGPKLSELAKLLSESEDQMFNKDGLVLGDLTLVDEEFQAFEDDEVNIGELNIKDMRERERVYIALTEAKRKVEAAKAASKDDPSGEKQQKAWCELANLENPNPYREQAQEACSQASSYVEQRKRIVAAMDRDWEKVEMMVSMQSYKPEDKKKALRAFARAYGVLKEQSRVQAVIYAYRLLEQGQLRPLSAVEHGIRSGSIEFDYEVDEEIRKQQQERLNETGPVKTAAPPATGSPPAGNRNVAVTPGGGPPAAGAGPAVPKADNQKPRKTKIGHALFWPGLVIGGFGGAAAGLANMYGKRGCEDQSNCDSSRTWAGVMWGSYAVSLAMMGTGIAMWTLGAKEKKEKAAPATGAKISLAPLFDGRSAALSISGKW